MQLADMARQSDVVFLCVPSWRAREALESLKVLPRETLLVSCTKGLLPEGKTIEEAIPEILPNSFVLFSGPTIAEDMCQGLPGTAVVADPVFDSEPHHENDQNPSSKNFQFVRRLFDGTNISIVFSRSAHSVAWASILKNIYAFFVGVADGAGLWHGNEERWRERIFQEWNTLADVLDIDASVLGGIAGKDDFLITAASPHSLNRKTGFDFGSGAKRILRGEGAHSLQPFVSLLSAKRISLPPCLAALENIVMKREDAHTNIQSLLV